MKPGDPFHDAETAAIFEDHAADSAYNAHYDRPAVLDLLGGVAGLRVLDAACGPGLYAEILADAGAIVTGFDASEAMLVLARARAGDRATFLHGELGQRLPLADASFDRVVCALAIHYANDRGAAFEEFFRLLHPGGLAVVSTQHPTADWLRLGGSYFDVRLESDRWSGKFGDTEFPFWREPLSFLCDAAIDAGFLIARIVEPRPTEVIAERWPRDYEQLSTLPGFVILSLLKPPGSQSEG